MKAIKINPADNVAVAVEALTKGETVTVEGEEITLLSDIPAGHKIALRAMGAEEKVIKYGYPLGHASRDIQKGDWIHSHNLVSDIQGALEYTYEPMEIKPLAPQPAASFKGYRRADGRVGIRNEVWIIPTVGCVNSVVCEMEKQAQSLLKTPGWESVEGIYAYNHPYGCSQLGNDMNMTLRYLCGLIRHPNAGAVLVVGLGCENGNLNELKKVLGAYDPDRVKFLNCQDEENEIETALALLKELTAYAAGFTRTECPASELVIGLKCGGSDGFSGITANPLLGRFSDKLIAQGGSTVLTEVPEMFGAETILMARCRTRELFEDTVRLINDFKAYFQRYGEKTDENPSPGNKAGGITTLAEKSLGCVQKGGSAPVEDVLAYGDPVRRKGLSLLNAPGNDLVASGALAVSGCQLVLFTTGRGTPFGCPVPTMKISSNSPLEHKKNSWIDFNAGSVLEGQCFEDLTEEFFRLVMAVASGEAKARAELLDKHELAIFKDGVTL